MDAAGTLGTQGAAVIFTLRAREEARSQLEMGIPWQEPWQSLMNKNLVAKILLIQSNWWPE